jgi:hypothetical protein
VLEDVGACLKHLKVEDAGDGLENIMRSRSMFVAEVEDAARWTIKALGQGAADLLQVLQKSPTLSVKEPHSQASCWRCPKRAFLIADEPSSKALLRMRVLQGASQAEATGRGLAAFVRCEDAIRFAAMW